MIVKTRKSGNKIKFSQLNNGEAFIYSGDKYKWYGVKSQYLFADNASIHNSICFKYYQWGNEKEGDTPFFLFVSDSSLVEKIQMKVTF